MQNRIMTEGPLHTQVGLLQESGYATAPLKWYDRSRIHAPKWRIKEWDSYFIANDSFSLALTISDFGCLGLDSIILMDMDKKEQYSACRTTRFSLGRRGLPAISAQGVARAVGNNYEMTFRAEEGKRQLYGHMYDFVTDSPLLFDLVLAEQRGDSAVLITPFRQKPAHFYYHQNINCLPAEGRVIFHNREYIFSPATSFGMMDWGRGVLPLRNAWRWASVSGIIGGIPFGMNLGYGIGDTSLANENMLFYGGKAHKLGVVRFQREPAEENKELCLWRVSDDAGRLALIFEPTLEADAGFPALLAPIRQRLVMGRYSGKAVLDDGRGLQISSMTGIMLDGFSRW
jgi:hypothetical protein